MERIRRWLRPLGVLLAIEFLDELIFGVTEAAWPLIQHDLGLSYVQIGLLIAVPGLFASLVEPLLGIAADMGHRRLLIVGGGAVYVVGLALMAVSQGFFALLIAIMLMYPASGAFVGLAQTVLMDTDSTRHDQNMARWTFAGSLGVVAGPILLGVWGEWRPVVMLLAGLTGLLTLFALRLKPPPSDERPAGLLTGLRDALRALRRWRVLRWLILLEASDLLLDVLLSYLALYVVNGLGLSPQSAVAAFTVWSVVGLVGDFLIIPLLERLDGVFYLRVSAVITLGLYPAFLLVGPFWAKLVILGLLGLFNAGWYAILQGRLYSEMPSRSGTVLAVTSLAGIVSALIPLGIGVVAEQAGLAPAMWLLLAGPILLIALLPFKGG